MTNPTLKAWHYIEGQWVEATDIVNQAWTADDSEDAVMDRLGYRRIHTIGSEYDMALAVWTQDNPSPAAPRHIIELPGDPGDYIYVETVPDLWDLLARWTPVVRDSAITRLIQDLNDVKSDTCGLVETIARRAAYGLKH